MSRFTYLRIGRNIPRSRTLKFLRILMVAGLAAEIWLLAQTPAADLAITKATTRMPEEFTEVYFVDPTHLPRNVIAGTTATAVYRVVNRHQTAMTYQIVITAVENNQPRLLGTQTATISAGAAQNFNANFDIARAGTNYTIVINLPAEHQSIRFRGTAQ